MSLSDVDADRLRLLSALLAMPQGDGLAVLSEMCPSAPWLEPALRELQEIPLERWQAEYTRLFVSGYPNTACPPYESAYRQGTMGGTAVADLMELYRRAGLEATEGVPDYLGTMLECAAYLRDRGMERLLEELVQGHMQRWVPRFARELQNQASLGLYRELGKQLRGLFSELPES